ncbi:MAG: hypothetical protein SFZ03_08385 [Candidatus Melainabacteria bacterium]|nr:hypothetical protein [Candidatus Melainabacteria bacterium]
MLLQPPPDRTPKTLLKQIKSVLKQATLPATEFEINSRILADRNFILTVSLNQAQTSVENRQESRSKIPWYERLNHCINHTYLAVRDILPEDKQFFSTLARCCGRVLGHFSL